MAHQACLASIFSQLLSDLAQFLGTIVPDTLCLQVRMLRSRLPMLSSSALRLLQSMDTRVQLFH